jgi:SHS2 domain-containing protein
VILTHAFSLLSRGGGVAGWPRIDNPRRRYSVSIESGRSAQVKLNTRSDAAARWEHYEHQADMGVRGFGSTREEAFEQAALALTAVVTDPALVERRERITIECEAPDEELLFADWLNALVYEMATRTMLFGRFSVRLEGSRLDAEAWGERVDRARHHPSVEVKGATYTTLHVARADGGWVAQTVVDV